MIDLPSLFGEDYHWKILDGNAGYIVQRELQRGHPILTFGLQVLSFSTVSTLSPTPWRRVSEPIAITVSSRARFPKSDIAFIASVVVVVEDGYHEDVTIADPDFSNS